MHRRKILIDNIKYSLKKNTFLYKTLRRCYGIFLYYLKAVRYGVHILPKHHYKYRKAGVVTHKNIDFMNEAEFKNANLKGMQQYTKYDANFGGFISHNILWAASHAIQLDGDFIECGVFRAGKAKAITEYVNFKQYSDKNYYLFDTFKGLPVKTAKASTIEHYQNTYFEDVSGFVEESFKDSPNVHLVKGIIPDTLKLRDIQKVAYMSIDMNSPYPEIQAMEYFWPKMVHAGIIVLDDYGWGGIHDEQKLAHDKFAKEKGVKILTLPTGQGFILKP